MNSIEKSNLLAERFWQRRQSVLDLWPQMQQKTFTIKPLTLLCSVWCKKNFRSTTAVTGIKHLGQSGINNEGAYNWIETHVQDVFFTCMEFKWHVFQKMLETEKGREIDKGWVKNLLWNPQVWKKVSIRRHFELFHSITRASIENRLAQVYKISGSKYAFY